MREPDRTPAPQVLGITVEIMAAGSLTVRADRLYGFRLCHGVAMLLADAAFADTCDAIHDLTAVSGLAVNGVALPCAPLLRDNSPPQARGECCPSAWARSMLARTWQPCCHQGFLPAPRAD